MRDFYCSWRKYAGIVSFGWTCRGVDWNVHVGVDRLCWGWGYDESHYDGVPIRRLGFGPLLLVCVMG